MDYNNIPYTTEYAVKLTNQSVTGLSFVLTSTLIVSSETNSLSSPSPTLWTNYSNSKFQ